VIRITTHQEKSRTVVTIDGRMTPADLEEVQNVRRSLPGSVTLHLGGLDACDDDGMRVLRDWLNAGARLGFATPFLRMVLEAANAPAPRSNQARGKGCRDSESRHYPK
jgi:hypothetical protein